MPGVSSAMMHRAKPQSDIGIPYTTDGVYLMNYVCNQQSRTKKELQGVWKMTQPGLQRDHSEFVTLKRFSHCEGLSIYAQRYSEVLGFWLNTSQNVGWYCDTAPCPGRISVRASLAAHILLVERLCIFYFLVACRCMQYKHFRKIRSFTAAGWWNCR